ncbi:helix-turn-helix domain-containing protein [Paenibacillaceae bacterium]|nr:helix-turn-helix domain-containing protein [Paenibacillaceae bacterium]
MTSFGGGMVSENFRLTGSFYWTTEFPLCITREREYFTLPLHAHDFIEINYVAEGRGFHYIGDKRFEVSRGDLFIIPIGTPHVFRPTSPQSKDELIVYNCLFNPDLLERLDTLPGYPAGIAKIFTGEHGLYHHYNDHNDEIRQLMGKLFSEYALQLPGFQAALIGMLLQLITILDRHCSHLEPFPTASPQLAAVFKHIALHLHEPLALRALAGLLPVSTSHFQRLFKHATGQSLTEYIQNQRIAKSCELLLRTSLSVREIAAAVGYKDMKFFHALFKKKTGLTPYRFKQNKQ